MRLFHFSETPGITEFVPRAVRVPAPRTPGMDWLNGPVVWAIAEEHQRLYLFPRDCPRIVLWARADTTAQDRTAWLATPCVALAYIERAWVDRFNQGSLWRYELPAQTFTDLDDAGMWVTPSAVEPCAVTHISDLGAGLTSCQTELRVVDSLLPLRDVWQTSLHASGIRLRNAHGWHDANTRSSQSGA
jgi:hypothetical protein